MVQNRRNRPLGTAVIALALAVAAGSTASVVAAERGLALVTAGDPGTRTLALAGQPAFRTTSAAISNQRLIPFSGSRTVVAVWDETAPSGSVEHCFAVSTDGRTFPLIQTTDNTIKLKYAQFDPAAGEPAVPAILRAGPGNEQYLVQFVCTPLEEMRAQIRAMGGTVERFMTENTHIIRLPAAAREKVAALPYVRYVGALEPAYRLSEEVRADVLLGDAERGRYSIECFERGPVQQQALANQIAKMGGIVEMVNPEQYRMEATLTPAQVLILASRNEVHFIDPIGPMTADMDIQRQIGGAVPLLSGLNILGQGVRGEVFDNGAIPNHVQWNGQAPLVNTTSNAPTDHGTACYGVNFATGTGDITATGMLPMREQGMVSNFTDCNQSGLGTGTIPRLTLNTNATNPAGGLRSCYQSSSVGSPQITTYSSVSAEVDDYLFRVDYLSCQSQSNTGNRTSRPQAWAKNIVSMGGVDHHDTLTKTDDTWASGASTGPSTELRVKPDLSHGWVDIYTTYSTSPTGYGQFGGTSAATPITAGHFGLLMQMWHQGIWAGFGGGPSVFADRPRSTTAKALMINTAYRYPVTQGQMVRAFVGWGQADVGYMYNIRDRTVIVNETDPVQNAQTNLYNVNVAPGEPELRVTMVYIDPMGPTTGTQARINDLTLKVTAPDSTVYWGNNGMIATAIAPPGQLAGANYSVAGGTPNTVDTVENVFLQNPASGAWTVEVIGSQVVADTVPSTPAIDASYALVVTGANNGPPPALRISLPSGVPSLVPPGTPADIPVTILPGTQNVQPGTPALKYRFNTSSSYLSTPMTSLGGTSYRATLPGANCGDTPQFYFTAMGDQGATVNNPGDAPTHFYTTQIGTLQPTTLFNVDFNGTLPAGWTATGLWHISSSCFPSGTPCAGSQAAYYGQDATCDYNTGATTTGNLTSPPIALPTLPAGGTLTLSYCSAAITENSTSYDKATVLINGTQVDRAAESAAWQTRNIDLTQMAGQNVTIAFKFDTVDLVNNTFRGWHVDAVKIVAVTAGCGSAPCYANCDGSTIPPILNVNDFVCFQTKYAAGDSAANCDGSTTPPILNVNDFICFQTKFAQGCP